MRYQWYILYIYLRKKYKSNNTGKLGEKKRHIYIISHRNESFNLDLLQCNIHLSCLNKGKGYNIFCNFSNKYKEVYVYALRCDSPFASINQKEQNYNCTGAENIKSLARIRHKLFRREKAGKETVRKVDVYIYKWKGFCTFGIICPCVRFYF